MTAHKDMTVEAKFKVGEYVQRVNQPELAGIVRELRWDAQVESWNYLVQFGAQLRALPSAKRAVESRLRSKNFTYTILQPTYFMDIWLGPALGFNHARAKAVVYGEGKNGCVAQSVGKLGEIVNLVQLPRD